uniref:Uncharacterized protein n=1 Tax=Arion vulgaris TaxID=1028688 RepID=A0A0B7A249_9EUPU
MSNNMFIKYKLGFIYTCQEDIQTIVYFSSIVSHWTLTNVNTTRLTNVLLIISYLAFQTVDGVLV